jgi:hypothetical protein
LRGNANSFPSFFPFTFPAVIDFLKETCS